MDEQIWIAACAHQLHRRWRTVAPESLAETAAALRHDEVLGRLTPEDAVHQWLQPLLDADRSAPF